MSRYPQKLRGTSLLTFHAKGWQDELPAVPRDLSSAQAMLRSIPASGRRSDRAQLFSRRTLSRESRIMLSSFMKLNFEIFQLFLQTGILGSQGIDGIFRAPCHQIFPNGITSKQTRKVTNRNVSPGTRVLFGRAKFGPCQISSWPSEQNCKIWAF